jgi:hypothetical protein
MYKLNYIYIHVIYKCVCIVYIYVNIIYYIENHHTVNGLIIYKGCDTVTTWDFSIQVIQVP